MIDLKTPLTAIFAGLVAASAPTSGNAAPLPTNVAAMKSMMSKDTVHVRWGGWRGNWG